MQVIRTSLFITDHPFLHKRYSCFSRFASQLYRHLGKNPLLDSPMKEKDLWLFPHFIKLLCKRRKKDTFFMGWMYPTGCGWRPRLVPLPPYGSWAWAELGVWCGYEFPPYTG